MEFLQFAKKEEIEFEQSEVDSTYSWIENELNGNIIGRKFGDVEQYKIAIHEDTQLQETLKIFDKYKTLDKMFFYAEELTALKEKEEKK